MTDDPIPAAPADPSAPACRFAEAGDVDALAALVSAMYRHYGMAREAEPATAAAYVHDRLLPAERAGSCRVALALVDGRPVGFATMVLLLPAPGPGVQAYMKDLFVTEEARGCGVGRCLIAFLARTAVAAGATRLDWTAETTNPGALATYDALGVRRLPEKVYYRLDGADLARWAADAPG